MDSLHTEGLQRRLASEARRLARRARSLRHAGRLIDAVNTRERASLLMAAARDVRRAAGGAR